MEIDEDLFRSILFETIDENPLACRALLFLCQIEFTTKVPTLSVSLGKKSTLFVNLDFVRKHCQTLEHVKALLVHEFLHILLGHTLRIERMNPALNIALDAVINAIIHRQLGTKFSSFMSRYYDAETGLLALLRPLKEEELDRYFSVGRLGMPVPTLLDLHIRLYSGAVLAEDVLEIAKSFGLAALREALAGGTLLLGGHDDPISSVEELGGNELKRFEQSITTIGEGVFRESKGFKHSPPVVVKKSASIPATFRKKALPVLERLLLPDPASQNATAIVRTHLAPILNTADRRGSLRALWSPLIPEIAWDTIYTKPEGSVQIYLDVSGSMDRFLDELVRLLAEFQTYIRKPLWAFSTEVYPARIINGKLDAKTTRGTSLACVFKHIGKTAPKKALIVTDGFVEYCRERPICTVEAIIPHNGESKVLKKTGIPVTRLPAILQNPR
jgi:hypothetical protein